VKAATSQIYRKTALLAVTLAISLIGLGSAWLEVQAAASPTKILATSHPALPLKVSASGRYLVDQNNVPFLIAGDVPQALVVMVSPAEAARYFDNRQAHGFNSMWINVLTAAPYYPDAREDGSTYDGTRPFTGYVQGGTDTAHYDLTTPNQAYFARVDEMLTLAQSHGMEVFLDPIETGQWVPTLRNNGVAAARAYGQYLGNRYKQFRNIIWLNGNDFNTWKTPGDDAVVEAVAEGIKSIAPEQLQTAELNVHTSSSLDDPTWAPIISLNSTYTYSPTYIQMLHSYNQTPVIPTYLVEAHYDLENVGKPRDYGTVSVLRREEYWTMLSGGKGQLYGSAYTWSFMSGWQFYLDTAGVTQFTIWKEFFSSLPWPDLVPDQDHTVVTSGLGSYGNIETRVSQSDFCTASRTPDGTLVIAYMPTSRTMTVNMRSLKAPAHATWFDPTNGAYTAAAREPLANRGARQFTPPGKNHDGDGDWVLLLDASGLTRTQVR
jgi:hypothetical protein